MNCAICKINKAHHKHHIISRSKGGKNDKWNLIELCPNCHYSVHLGDIIIEGKFMTTNGLELVWHKKGAETITGSTPDVYLINHSQ